MDINRLTEKVQEALAAAQSTAARNNHQQVDVEHLCSALFEQEGGLASSILARAEVDSGCSPGASGRSSNGSPV